jgi:hypothetical protein
MPTVASHPSCLHGAALLLLALFALAGTNGASAEKKTVCTVTVNSADEKEAFRKVLGPGQYDFVELVEHGRSDWLESACRTGVRCDVLVISGHYDGGNEFFSDRTEAREYLPVDELERVSCNGSCPGLFSQLKEVYLFGCNSLNSEPNASVAGEVGRSLQRAGLSRAEAERTARSLAARHAESAKDRMRLIFKDVPAIYGFSAVAPLGPTAASILRRHFQAGGAGDVGTGRTSGRLLSQFSAHAMTVTSGLSPNDPLQAHRRDVCQFANDSVPPEQRANFVHKLFEREIAEARMFLGRLEKFADALPPPAQRPAALAASMDGIARDGAVRQRYLELARDADAAPTRARHDRVGREAWMARRQPGTEEIFRDVRGAPRAQRRDACRSRSRLQPQSRWRPSTASISPAETRTVCRTPPCSRASATRRRAIASVRARPAAAKTTYGSRKSCSRIVLSTSAGSCRSVMNEIAGMTSREAQMRALHALASQRPHRSCNDVRARAPVSRAVDSAGVQTAIATVLLRSDFRSIASADVVQTLRTGRMRGNGAEDAIDVLIRRMQLHVQ